ncbi:MAG: class I SAM-dependent methyltransferase, partial [Ktedonobacteraceae bacterium]|nr:class I SAM-dependent methyltransferase [Ktedonobacteraceae bacterium]
MKNIPFDPTHYNIAQRQGWDNVATGWRRWWETFERAGQAVSDHLVSMAEITAGQRVLDIATGIGEPAMTAAHRVGPAGEVIALDFAEAMVAIAQERAVAHGRENITFVLSDAEQLDLPQQSFDAALSRWGLMFLPNLVPTLRGIRQCLKEGGRLAAAVWSTPEKAAVASLAFRVVSQHVPVPPSSPGTPGPFRLAEPLALTQSLEQAGFGNVRSECITIVWEFATAEDYTRFQREIAPPITAMI